MSAAQSSTCCSPLDLPTRVPVAAITGTNGKTTTSRMLAHVLKLSGMTVGLTSTDGVYIDGKLSVPGDMTGPKSAHMILRDPSVDAAVMETARGGMLRSGLGILALQCGGLSQRVRRSSRSARYRHHGAARHCQARARGDRDGRCGVERRRPPVPARWPITPRRSACVTSR